MSKLRRIAEMLRDYGRWKGVMYINENGSENYIPVSKAIEIVIAEKSEEEEKIKFVAQYYGYEHQSRQCMEEMAELTQAINKHWRKEIPNRNNHELLNKIYEEIADVEFCLEQIKYLLNCNAEVEAVLSYKVDREIQRIEEAGGMDE